MNCSCGRYLLCPTGDCSPWPDDNEGETPEDWNADENRYLTRMEWKAQQREKDLG